MIFELVYPFACLMAAILLPMMVTTPPQRERVVRRPKPQAIRKAKKNKTKKANGWYKAPALTPQQQAAIERYRLGGNRSQIEIGGVIPI